MGERMDKQYGVSSKKVNSRVLELAQMGIFTALLIVCAQLVIPMPMGVPLTLQTFGVLLAGSVLGVRKGAIATSAYLLLGMIGLPVFQSFTGGISLFAGPTGGFLLSFPLMALIVGAFLRLGQGRSKGQALVLNFVGALLAVVCNLSLGMLFFAFNMGTDIGRAFYLVVLPFLLVELVKVVGATLLGSSIRIALTRQRLL